jgi:hypothetical protein
MAHKTFYLINWIFLVLKCFGLSAYTLKNNESNQTIVFKRTNWDKLINLLIFLIVVILTANMTDCHKEFNKTGFISGHITKIFFYIYFLLLMITMNYKQTEFVDIFYKIMEFERITNQDLNKKISVLKMSRILKYFVLKLFIGFVFMLVSNLYLVSIQNLIKNTCFLKGVITTIVTHHSETLIFYYIITVKDIVYHLNKSLKAANDILVVRRKYQLCLDIKKKIEKVSQFYLIFKLGYIISEFSTAMYTAITVTQMMDLFEHFLSNLHIFGLFAYNFSELLWLMVFTVYPYASFSQEVS